MTSWMTSMRISSARAAIAPHALMGLPGPLAAFEDSRALAQAIVDTVREPLLVLDKNQRVIAASRSFYENFQVDRKDTRGQLLYALGNGQWAIPALRTLLEKSCPKSR